MCIDIVNILRFHPGIMERSPHHIFGAQPFGMGCCYMISVCRGAATDDFTIDPGAPGPGMFELLQNEYPCCLAHHKAVPVLVVGPAGCSKIVVAFAERLHRVESAYTGFADNCL